MAIKFSLIKVSKAERSGGGKSLIHRDKNDFIIRMRASYKKDSLGQINFKKLMEVAKFRGVEFRRGDDDKFYVGDRAKIIADLDKQIASAKGEQLEALKAQKEFIGQFKDGNFWNISAKDMELPENLEMLLELNNNGCL